VDVVASFFKLLYSVIERWEGEDKLWRAPSKKWLVAVKSFYSVLVCKDDGLFPWRSIWRTKVPFAGGFFFFFSDSRENPYHGQFKKAAHHCH
jgi:hypothetical protein